MNNSVLTSRRELLATAAAGARAASVQPLRIGFIGVGGQGQLLMNCFRGEPGVTIAAVCDVYQPRLESAAKAAGGDAKRYRDYRSLLADRQLHAVVIATPEHWHHRMFLDALAAGRDIYLEKPFCHTRSQGAEMLAAAESSRSVVQIGMQRRSFALFEEGRRLWRSGELGHVRMVRASWLRGAGNIALGEITGPIDWRQWLGPAPPQPVSAERFFLWRDFRDYSGGMLADLGTHIFDAIHMITGSERPVAVTACAALPAADRARFPDTIVVTAEYPENFLATFALNCQAMPYRLREDQCISFDGDRARLDLGRETLGLFVKGEENKPRWAKQMGFAAATQAHVRDFVACVGTRRQPTGSVRRAFHASLVTLLANQSLAEGRRVVC